MAIQSGCALFVRQHIAAVDHPDPFGKFAALPPAIKQRCNTPRHQDRHIGNDPVCRIARSDSNPVADFKAVTLYQPACQCACGGMAIGKCQPLIAVNQKFLVSVHHAKCSEIVAQIGGRLVQIGQFLSIFFDIAERQRAIFGRQPSNSCLNCLIEKGRHCESLLFVFSLLS